MPRLTQQKLAEINSRLDQSIYTSALFQVRSTDDNVVIAKIEYIDNPKFYILYYLGKPRGVNPIQDVAVAMTAKTIRIVECSPGEDLVVEQSEDVDFSEFLTHLSQWVTRLRREIGIMRAVTNEFAQFRDALLKEIDERLPNKGEYIDQSEVEGLKKMVDDLSKRYSEIFVRLGATEKDLAEFKQSMEQSTASATEVTKGGFMRSIAARLYNFGKRFASTPEGQKMIREGATQIFQLANKG